MPMLRDLSLMTSDFVTNRRPTSIRSSARLLIMLRREGANQEFAGDRPGLGVRAT